MIIKMHCLHLLLVADALHSFQIVTRGIHLYISNTLINRLTIPNKMVTNAFLPELYVQYTYYRLCCFIYHSLRACVFGYITRQLKSPFCLAKSPRKSDCSPISFICGNGPFSRSPNDSHTNRNDACQMYKTAASASAATTTIDLA